MDDTVRRHVIGEAIMRADPDYVEDAIVAALGVAENIQRDIRRNDQKVADAEEAHRAKIAELAKELYAIRDRCPHVPSGWHYRCEMPPYRDCLLCGKELP